MLFDRVYKLLVGSKGSSNRTPMTQAQKDLVANQRDIESRGPLPPMPKEIGFGTMAVELTPAQKELIAAQRNIESRHPEMGTTKATSGPASGSGIEISELRIQFEIEKTAKKNPNKSSIKIYNLTKATRAELEKPDTRCVLYAGYKDDAGALLIFQGAVTFAWSKYDLPDVITEFELGDGAPEIRDTTISVGYDKGVKSTQILNDVAKKMGTPLVLPSDAPTRQWENGLSHHGSARSLLDKVTKGTGLEWSIQNGNLQVIKTGMVTTRKGIVISADSGLIGSPERERKSKDGTVEVDDTNKKKQKVKEATKHYDGWSVKTLLMPELNPGDRVKLEARDVSGIFRIQELKHRGDSHDGDWQTEMKLIDPALPLTEPDSKSTGGKHSRGETPKSKSASNIHFGPGTA